MMVAINVDLFVRVKSWHQKSVDFYFEKYTLFPNFQIKIFLITKRIPRSKYLKLRGSTETFLQKKS